MTKKTNLALTFAALALGVFSVRGQTTATTPATTPSTTPVPVAPTPPTSSWVFNVTFVTDYMFRGVHSGGPSFEPYVEYDSGPLALGVWTNFPTDQTVPGVSDPEIDPYGSYTFTINDAFSIQPGFTWYNYPHADENNGFYKMTFEPNVAFNYTVSGVKFQPKIYYDMVLQGPTFELNISWAVPLKDLGSELDFLATVGTFKLNDAAKGANPEVENEGDYWLLGVSAPINFSANSKLIIGVAYTEGSANKFKQSGVTFKNPLAEGRWVGSLGYTFTF